jgi:hypothetical protein
MEKQIKVSLLDEGIGVNYNDYNSILNLNLNDSIIEYEKVFKDLLKTFSRDVDYLYVYLNYNNNDKLIQVTSFLNEVVDYNRTYKNRIIVTIIHNNNQKQQFLG